jgi:L-2,4-diaminobutyric acid acetyltransferase
VNSRYAYLLWFRDFAATSIVAKMNGEIVGFVSGYRRPDERRTLVVWQVAVAEGARGQGLAAAMVDSLFEGAPDADYLETTITPDNAGSGLSPSGTTQRCGATSCSGRTSSVQVTSPKSSSESVRSRNQTLKDDDDRFRRSGI